MQFGFSSASTESACIITWMIFSHMLAFLYLLSGFY